MLHCNKKIVLRKVKHAVTNFQKMKGLLSENKINFDYALIFHLNSESILSASIHMLFMQFSIDVVWLDSKKTIVDLKQDLRPWTFNSSPRKPANYIIELPINSIKKNKLKIGQKLSW